VFWSFYFILFYFPDIRHVRALSLLGIEVWEFMGVFLRYKSLRLPITLVLTSLICNITLLQAKITIVMTNSHWVQTFAPDCTIILRNYTIRGVEGVLNPPVLPPSHSSGGSGHIYIDSQFLIYRTAGYCTGGYSIL
jgi:hypothetical protein